MREQLEIATGGAAWLGLRVLLLALGVHLVLLLVSFGWHRFDAGARGERQPLGRYVRAFVSEWWSSLLYLLVMPLGWLPRFGPSSSGPAGGPPVLLVHGYFVNRACMFVMHWRLRRRGMRNVHSVNLHPMLRGIDAMAKHLAARIREVSRAHDGRPVVAVAHSMGGLVLRWILQSRPDVPLARVVTIGTPHRGTRAALLGFTPAAHEMRAGSRFLRSLSPEPPRPVVSIYSRLDQMVLPFSSAAFGEQPTDAGALGHIALLYSRRVLELVVAQLRRAP